MQPYGVPVFDEYYGPTGAFRGTETCDVAAYMWSQNLLLSISGQGRMADRIERAFFNAAPAAVSRDFKTHVYFQSPNRMADKSLPAAGQFTFQAKHSPLCCTAALNRFLPNYVINMWMATRDNGLAATCYGPCKVSALVADRVPVQLVCKTDYPFNETIEITVKPEREAKFPLLFRIPGWCKNPVLQGERFRGEGVARCQRFCANRTALETERHDASSISHVAQHCDGKRHERRRRSLRLGVVRAAFVRFADSRHERREHAGPGGEVAVCR